MWQGDKLFAPPNYPGHMFDPSAAAGRAAPQMAKPIKHTTSPMVMGTSVVAVKYNGGVVVAADTCGGYGSMKMFKHISRLRTHGTDALVGATGEYSDFQAIMDYLEDKEIEELEYNDGARTTPAELHSTLATILYNKRNKMDPFYNQLVVAGFRDGKAFLGYADMHGSNYVDDHVATGYGAYLAKPLLRKYYRPDLTQREAIQLVEKCMTVLFYRDKMAINKVQIAIADAEGSRVQPPRELATEWEHLEKTENRAVQTVVQLRQPVV